MKDVLLTLLDLAVTAAKLWRPGGVRAVIAENLLLKQQLIVLRRPRRRAQNLTGWETVCCADSGRCFSVQGASGRSPSGYAPRRS